MKKLIGRKTRRWLAEWEGGEGGQPGGGHGKGDKAERENDVHGGGVGQLFKVQLIGARKSCSNKFPALCLTYHLNHEFRTPTAMFSLDQQET